MQSNELSNIELLKEIAEFLNEETEMEQMLQGALQKLLEGTIFETGWIFFINKKGKQQLITHEKLPRALQENECKHLQKGGCWCVTRFQKGDLNKASNIIECKRIVNARNMNREDHGGITHHATVPLQSGQEQFGLLNVATPNTIRFEEGELALLESVAFQIGSAIKRIYLTKQEQQVALVQERNRLARDLHDSVNQLLFSVTLTARGGVEMTDQKEIKETFKEIQYLTQDALTEMRALIWQLRPKGLESGIIEGIKGYGEILGLTLTVKVKGVVNLPASIEETLFRIAQEALNNVRKHSGVLKAELYLTVTPTDILLVVKDEGRGFHMNELKSLPSIGLQSMRDRARAVGGTVDWVTEWNKGTEILVRLPY
ncbi:MULTISPECIES: GAF domain-containing sensor histidine kinase [Bacillaceae]|uniref:GAF domain-containing sensor histidine kinase n=1 Tax=Bacillaceae TaxID=186817 RepID=UPI0006B03264|nr:MULTISPECIES: GAF domain-containing sensor histidine kinase [Bacillaceae]ALC84414.1 histidine kinase [Bacillus sp. FJAT-22090]KQL33216.1 histidine kinase [Psychrobacillus sp. FJAT-21963]MDF2065240.1 GAF domain-containing sensor histidine kinase [Bacillus sp. Cr_A10]